MRRSRRLVTNKTRNNRKSRRNVSGPKRLPMNNCDLTITKRIRYVVVNSGHTQITRGQILNLIVVPSSATSAYCLLKAARIRKIEAWSVTTSSSAPLGNGEEIVITWRSTLGKELTERGSQMGIEPAYVKTRPPPDSLSAYWTNIDTANLTTVLVDVFMPSDGGIVDITYDLQIVNNSPARSVSITAGNAGVVSYSDLVNYSNQGYADYTV